MVAHTEPQTKLVKPRTKAGKRVLEKRAPKLVSACWGGMGASWADRTHACRSGAQCMLLAADGSGGKDHVPPTAAARSSLKQALRQQHCTRAPAFLLVLCSLALGLPVPLVPAAAWAPLHRT